VIRIVLQIEALWKSLVEISGLLTDEGTERGKTC
jgi:hypothetical protein